MAFTSRRLATAALIAALALPVLAQTASTVPAGESNATSASPQQRQARDPARMQERMQKRMAQHLADLKTRLQITPAQEGAWTTFANSLQSAKCGPGMNRQDMEQLSTPERIDRMRALRAERAAEADRHGDATKALYVALTPAQQKTFDEQTLRQHRRGFGKHMGRGDHGGMHHHGMHRML